MKAAFFIGNGFDLQLGMETSYQSFLKWYVEQPTDDPDIEQFREYLKDDRGEWWSDAEIAMGQYLEYFTDDTIGVFFKNIRDFKLRLSEYLLAENLKYDLENDPDVVDAFKAFITESPEDILVRANSVYLKANRSIHDMEYHFISFNYTDALDRIINKIKESYPLLERFVTPDGVYRTTVGNVYHVHGSLDTSLIMGVDSIEQLKLDNIHNTTKLNRTLIKPIVNDALGNDVYTMASALLRECNYLFFYGLSFGITDKTWWDIIKNHLIQHKSCQVILFVRTSVDSLKTIIPEDVLDFVQEQKAQFLDKIGIHPESEHYEDVGERVFIVLNTKRLNISIKDRKMLAGV